MVLDTVINHIRNRPFMSGVDRDKSRIKMTEECFTPTEICLETILYYETIDPALFQDSTKTFLDPSCGDGQFLGEVLIRKIQNGIDFEQALSTIYGVDLMPDNVKLCQDRLLCGQEHLRYIVEKNIVCHDALTYNYTFGETETFGNNLFEVVDNT
jgi:hypothetical protein